MRLTGKWKTLDSALEKRVGAENCNTVRLTGAALLGCFMFWRAAKLKQPEEDK